MVFTFITGPQLTGPGSVKGPSLWLKANDGAVQTSGNLTDWTDKAGANDFATTIGTITYTENSLNFNPAVSIDNTGGTPGTLAANRLDGNNSIEFVDGFAVYKSSANLYTLIGSTVVGNNYGPGVFLGDASGSPRVYAGNGTSSTYQYYSNPNLSLFNIANIDVSKTDSPFATGSLNGLGQSVSNGGGNDFSNITLTPMIGGTNNNGNGNGFYPFTGSVSEVVLYPKGLTATEKLKIESYLALKYGITLDVSVTNYLSSTGTPIWNNTTYWHDVFGIGKDDGSQLNQTTSNSYNTGAGDGTGQNGKGNIVLSNASSLDNNDFLLIGHDNAGLTMSTSEIPASYPTATRFAREWKTKSSGNPGNITISFDINGLSTTFASTDAQDYLIFIDTDGNGNFTDGSVLAYGGDSYSSGVITFEQVSLADGAVITFGQQTEIVWTGSSSTSWTDNGNWNSNLVPGAYSNVRIPNTTNKPAMAATTQVTVGNLTIEAGGALTIASDATGTGSLKINGTLSNSGTITSQHYLEGTAQAWHMIGAPVDGSIATNGWNPTPGQDDFYAWDEPTLGTWVNYDNTGTPSFTDVNGGMDFVPGKGYLVAYNAANPTKTFVGTLTTGNVNFPLKRSAAKAWTYYSGWNLMANPYSSAIDWNLATRTQFEDNFAYAYDPNKSGGEGYENIDGSQANAFIAPHQAFFVRATQAANNQNFTFTNAIQAHGGTNYKQGNSTSGIVLRLASGDFYDETTIRLMDESTANRDRNDAVKMYSFNPAVPQLYSLSDDGASLAVNSMNQISAENPIAMGFKAGTEASYTLSLVHSNAQLTGSGLFIEDKNLGIIHRIDQSAYSFNAEPGEVTDRFVLHFGLVGLDEPAQESAANVWFAGEQLYLQSSEAFQQMDLFDLQGRRIFSSSLSDAPLQQLSIKNLQNGLYIVRLSGAEKVFSAKVKFIR